MSNDPLERLLKEFYSNHRSQGGPAGNAEVWRAIDERRRRPLWRLFVRFFEDADPFSRPVAAAAALAIAVGAGIVPILLSAQPENERRMAERSLHFEFFVAARDLSGIGAVHPHRHP
jgi:hypothetical protein